MAYSYYPLKCTNNQAKTGNLQFSAQHVESFLEWTFEYFDGSVEAKYKVIADKPGEFFLIFLTLDVQRLHFSDLDSLAFFIQPFPFVEKKVVILQLEAWMADNQEMVWTGSIIDFQGVVLRNV